MAPRAPYISDACLGFDGHPFLSLTLIPFALNIRLLSSTCPTFLSTPTAAMACKCQCRLGPAQSYATRVKQQDLVTTLDYQLSSTLVRRSSFRRLASADNVPRGSPKPLHPGSSMVRHASIMYAFSLLTLALEFLKLRRVLTQVFHAR